MKKTTNVYAVEGKQKLAFDLYLPDDDCGEKRELVIQLHRGNFATGSRNGNMERATCEYLCEAGYVVASMDYRLGLQNQPFRPDTILQAVHQGIDNLVDMTLYALEHAEEWNVRGDRIMIVSSGAGAVVALTAEYELLGGRLERLPQMFNYSLIIANTGAIAVAEAELQWRRPSCPIMLILSERDAVVPAERFYVPGLLLIGGQHLQQEISRSGALCMLYDMLGNSRSTDPKDIHEALDFLMLQGVKLQVT